MEKENEIHWSLQKLTMWYVTCKTVKGHQQSGKNGQKVHSYHLNHQHLSNRTALFGMCHPRHHPPGTSYQDIHHHHHRFKGGHQHKWYQKWIGHTIQQMKKSLTWMKVLLSHIQSYWRRQSRGKGFDIVGNWIFVNYDCIINTDNAPSSGKFGRQCFFHYWERSEIDT